MKQLWAMDETLDASFTRGAGFESSHRNFSYKKCFLLTVKIMDTLMNSKTIMLHHSPKRT